MCWPGKQNVPRGAVMLTLANNLASIPTHTENNFKKSPLLIVNGIFTELGLNQIDEYSPAITSFMYYRIVPPPSTCCIFQKPFLYFNFNLHAS
jgi:hypothetical protein